MTERIVPWHARLAANEEAVVEERIARAKVIERERLKLIKILDDFDARLAIEKAERLEREALVLQKVSDESFKVQEEQADERNRREATLGHLRDETDAIDAMRDKPDALFKDGLMSRMVAATKNIKLETSQRVAASLDHVRRKTRPPATRLRRGAQRQHVHLGAQLLQPLLELEHRTIFEELPLLARRHQRLERRERDLPVLPELLGNVVDREAVRMDHRKRERHRRRYGSRRRRAGRRQRY